MKAKHTILLIALGFALGYLGTLTKIMHRTEANTLLTIGTILKVVGILWLAYKVIRYEGFRKFMER
jgi:uncharacterized membrane protein YidH (DUF202 family)